MRLCILVLYTAVASLPLCGVVAAADDEVIADTVADPAADHDVADDTPGDPTRIPCVELEDEAQRLDNFRIGVERSVCVTAWYFDRMFGALPEDEIVATRRTRGRLRGGVTWDEREGFGEEASLNGQLRLPIAERRLLAVFGRDTDEAFIEGGTDEFDSVAFTDEDEERSWLLGLGFEPMRGTRSRLGLGAGVRLRNPPDPFVQASYWFQDRLGENWLFRARQTVFWEYEDGFGTATRLRFERGLGPTRLLRWGNHARLSEGTDGTRWNTNLALFQALSARRAVALRGAVLGETGREVNPVEYQATVIYRQRVFRDWLFLELRGGGAWIRESSDESREFVPQGAVVMEMTFGYPDRSPTSVFEE